MGRKRMSTNEFVNRAKVIHGDRYNYEKTIFDRIDRNIIYVCSKHGQITQRAAIHLKGGGCKKCHIDSVRKSLACFIKQAKEVHGNKFDYTKSKYVNDHTKVEIVCKVHGEFFQKPNKHLAGTGCPKCANKLQNAEDFVRKAKRKHGDKYDYAQSVYVNDITKICITCKTHGNFFQLPSNHHSLGQGCPACKLEKAKDNIGYYNEQLFKTQPDIKNKTAYFYTIKCCGNGEEFYKVGITTETELKDRFYSIPYTYTIEKSIKISLYEAFVLEQNFLKQRNIKKYKPKKKFHGWTECFVFL